MTYLGYIYLYYWLFKSAENLYEWNSDDRCAMTIVFNNKERISGLLILL
jgi:hypothetical protein